MSIRAWLTSMATAFSVAAAAGLAQLGLAYGLDITTWQEDSVVDDVLWASNMAWTTWLAAVATVVGAMVGGYPHRQVSARISAVLAAGAGAFIVGPLVSLPAREVTTDDFPLTPLADAGIGIAAGLVVAVIALTSRAVAANVLASVGLVWTLAILAVFAPVGDVNEDLIELAVWGSWSDVSTALDRRGIAIGLPFLIGSLLIGVIVALAARANGTGHRIAAASGVAGPLLVTVAHLAAGPGNEQDVDRFAVSLLGPYAAIAGLLGSLLVSTLLRRSEPAAVPRTAAGTDERTVVPTPPAEPTHELPSDTPPNPYVAEDPYVADSGTLGEFAEPQSARPGEDVGTRPAASQDATESWVSDLKTDTKPPAKKRRSRRKAKNDEDQ